MSILQESQNISHIMTAHRHYLHQIPELGLELPQTAAYVEEQLRKMGYETKRVGEYGVTALAGKKEGKCFLLRADMDALPVTEETDLEYKSTNGRMHACGHDCHASMLLGAAQILKDHEDELPGQVKLLFQPAEETMDGGKMVLENGILDNPKVDAAMAEHVFTAVPMPIGTVLMTGVRSKMAAVDWFTIRIKGKGCHGAMPNSGVDPLNVMVHIHLALQVIDSREMDPMDNLVLTIGQMHGGETSNVIPNEAMMSGTIRTLRNDTRAMVKERMEAIVAAIATAFNAEACVEWGSGCPVLFQNADLYAETKKYLKAEPGMFLIDLDDTSPDMGGGMGSEDFSYIANEVPSVFIGIPAGPVQEGYTFPQHHPKAMFKDEALPFGAAAYAHVAMEWLKNNA